MNAPTDTFRRQRPGRFERGFSLVEILIGLLISMIAVVIMMEVLITSEQRTRTTNSGNDAVSAGAVTLHMLMTDLKQAGYGFNSASTLGCTLTVPTGASLPLAPVVINPATSIVPAGDPNTDTLLVIVGSGNGQPEGNVVNSVAGSAYSVQAPAAFSAGDYVVPSPCAGATLAKVTGITAVAVTVDTVQATATALYNLGNAPRIVAYAVHAGALTSCDFMVSDCRTYNATNWAAVSGNIVSLRAQYGRDTNAGSMNGQVDTWDQTTPASGCGWVRTPAVRLGLLARSTQYESAIDPVTKQRTCEAVTTITPAWTGSTGASTAPFVVNTASDWQCYRYKTFESTAPARNMIWTSSESAC